METGRGESEGAIMNSESELPEIGERTKVKTPYNLTFAQAMKFLLLDTEEVLGNNSKLRFQRRRSQFREHALRAE
jgi:hypothetical protein